MKIKSTTKRQLEVQLPVGMVIVTTFASFAARGQPITDVIQNPDGCIITVRNQPYSHISCGEMANAFVSMLEPILTSQLVIVSS